MSGLLTRIDNDGTCDRMTECMAVDVRCLHEYLPSSNKWNLQQEWYAVRWTCHTVIKALAKFLLAAHGRHIERLVW